MPWLPCSENSYTRLPESLRIYSMEIGLFRCSEIRCLLRHPKWCHGGSETAHWLTIPERGLFMGTAIIGAIGTGKTSCCMYLFAEPSYEQ
jgi:hypothetical protein